MTRATASSKNGDSARAVLPEEALASIALALPEEQAPAGLWRRIEAAIDAADLAGRPSTDVRREDGWRQYSRDVQIKPLWDDKTFLLRCAPGGILPAHRHPHFEHCVVLEGDMIVSGETYRSGDYHGVPAHVAHKRITSRTGLLMLVRYE